MGDSGSVSAITVGKNTGSIPTTRNNVQNDYSEKSQLQKMLEKHGNNIFTAAAAGKEQ